MYIHECYTPADPWRRAGLQPEGVYCTHACRAPTDPWRRVAVDQVGYVHTSVVLFCDHQVMRLMPSSFYLCWGGQGKLRNHSLKGTDEDTRR